MGSTSDPNRLIAYPFRWPAWMYEQAAEAATDRAMPVAVWLREAALEKLERDGYRKEGKP